MSFFGAWCLILVDETMAKIDRSTLEIWDKSDSFRIVDAAYLWIEIDPPPGGEIYDGKINALCQALSSQVHKLSPSSHNKDLKPSDLISRADCLKIAHTWGNKPKFLYPEKRRKKTGMSRGTIKVYENSFNKMNTLIRQDNSISKASRMLVVEIGDPSETIRANYYRYKRSLSGL